MKSTKIVIKVNVSAAPETVWKYWTDPDHIIKWNHATQDWHTTKAESDLRIGGKFLSRMEAKDGSTGFDFGGIYTIVVENNRIAYTLDDGRRVVVNFYEENGKTTIEQIFEAEETNSVDMQKSRWKAILDNFKSYLESQNPN